LGDPNLPWRGAVPRQRPREVTPHGLRQRDVSHTRLLREPRDIVSWNRYDRGSHFALHEAPDPLLEDIRQFFRALR
jgi:hypothetical protein